jgi:hypothetical protein
MFTNRGPLEIGCLLGSCFSLKRSYKASRSCSTREQGYRLGWGVQILEGRWQDMRKIACSDGHWILAADLPVVLIV